MLYDAGSTLQLVLDPEGYEVSIWKGDQVKKVPLLGWAVVVTSHDPSTRTIGTTIEPVLLLTEGAITMLEYRDLYGEEDSFTIS